jgi:hypothetical protein
MRLALLLINVTIFTILLLFAHTSHGFTFSMNNLRKALGLEPIEVEAEDESTNEDDGFASLIRGGAFIEPEEADISPDEYTNSLTDRDVTLNAADFELGEMPPPESARFLDGETEAERNAEVEILNLRGEMEWVEPEWKAIRTDNERLDLVFLLDGSGSIKYYADLLGIDTWSLLKNFIKDTIGSFDTHNSKYACYCS